ncbi:hypothetical protein CR970_03640 [Candidatus Saccharibacteria bacterium]|nr:MAG: hypothetical protein CR970_03640 [Candidatus Saccharibacteria bacterium]
MSEQRPDGPHEPEAHFSGPLLPEQGAGEYPNPWEVPGQETDDRIPNDAETLEYGDPEYADRKTVSFGTDDRQRDGYEVFPSDAETTPYSQYDETVHDGMTKPHSPEAWAPPADGYDDFEGGEEPLFPDEAVKPHDPEEWRRWMQPPSGDLGEGPTREELDQLPPPHPDDRAGP